MIPTPKLKMLILEQFARGLETRNTQNSQQLWTDISSELKQFLPIFGNAVIGPLCIKKFFFKEILPDLEHCNYGLNVHVLRKIENLVKISALEETNNLNTVEENDQTVCERQQETAINDTSDVSSATYQIECDEDSEELPDSDYEEFIEAANVPSNMPPADSLQIHRRQDKTSNDNHAESSTTDFREGADTTTPRGPSAASDVKIVEAKGKEYEPVKRKPKIIPLEEFLECYHMKKNKQ